MMPVIQQPRLRATFIHLAITIVIILVLLAWMMAAWFSPLLFTSNGGWHGLAIITLVALASGPLLTYVIFSSGKARHLIVFDLACIAVVQMLALGYGAYTVYSTRPVVMSYWDGWIYPVTSEELALQDVTPADIAALDDRWPPLVFVRAPQNREERHALVDYGFKHGLGEPALAFLYEPFDEHLDAVFANSVENRAKTNPVWLEMRSDYVNDRILSAGHAFIPYLGSHGERLLIISRAGEIIGALAAPQ
ncbi:MAG: hypothetical protein U5P41_15420 [Gammaproteobacteria bacterium]|nr:hypothetical protein [Gammaproteobacteria bacterium]